MAMTLLTTNTESGDANSAFTSSIDSTYKLYVFKFYEVNPATDNSEFLFNVSIDGGSNYNVTKVTTFFNAYHDEADSDNAIGYDADIDIASGTGYQTLGWNVGNGADESIAGELFLFNPSNTTYVKHFYCTNQEYHGSNYSQNQFIGGYFNTTSAINAIDFKFDSGNFDGIIKMYGVS